MKKRLGAVVMAGLMACSMAVTLAVSGCGGGQKADFVMPEGGFDTSKEVTITFYHQMGNNLNKILNTYITRFEKMYPNIKVEHTAQGDWTNLLKTVSTEIQAGKQPNLAYCYSDHVARYNRSQAVQSLDGFLAGGEYANVMIPTVLVDPEGNYIDEEGNLLDEGAEPVTVERPLGLTAEEQANFNERYFAEGSEYGDGLTYTLPWLKSTEVMFYDKNFFKQHNLEVPVTWDEMWALCKKIKDEIDSSIVPLGYDSEGNLFITLCEQLGTPYTSATGDHFLFNNDANKAFVTDLKDKVDKGYLTTAAVSGADYTSSLFTEGKICMSIGSTGGTTYNTDTGGTTASIDMGIAPIPQQTADESQYKLISQGPSACIFKSDDPQEVIASWLFLKYFTTNPYYQLEASLNNGYMPVLKKSYMETIPAFNEAMEAANGGFHATAQAIKVGMEYEKYYFTSPAFYGSSDAREQVELLVQSVLTGTKTVDQAFNDAYQNCYLKYGK